MYQLVFISTTWWLASCISYILSIQLGGSHAQRNVSRKNATYGKFNMLIHIRSSLWYYVYCMMYIQHSKGHCVKNTDDLYLDVVIFNAINSKTGCQHMRCRRVIHFF